MLFSEKIYSLLKKIPKGKVTTYKILAEKLNTKAYRAVGQSLRRNKNCPEIPCYKVVKSNGLIGGFSGKTKGKNIKKKINYLKREGIIVKNNKVKDFENILYGF